MPRDSAQVPVLKDISLDLREGSSFGEGEYTASSIEVLEGLEPVRRRPGMYIGGTDAQALHHLFSEVLDNAVDEAIAGYGADIIVTYGADGSLTVEDHGRGIPIDPHPKFPGSSALEVILTTLHSGGKFGSGAYQASGGLHGVGVSVVNALSSLLEVTVVRGREAFRQTFSRGHRTSGLEPLGRVRKKSGTTLRFIPDGEIFQGGIAFSPAILFERIQAKAYLFSGVRVHWHCAPENLEDKDRTPLEAVLHFPDGLKDFLKTRLSEDSSLLEEIFAARIGEVGQPGSLEWALSWSDEGEGFFKSYCNTVPTPLGGTHEQAFRAAFLKSLKAYGERTNAKKAAILTHEDVFSCAFGVISFFMGDPEFQGQTKEKLVSASALRMIESVVRDYVDHWLTGHPAQADRLLSFCLDRAQERLDRRQEREISRKTAVRRLRLPGKLSDCTSGKASQSELFIVEGDSAGGSAKQARARAYQAVLPLRGKILNVAHCPREKIEANQQIQDLILALGCGTRTRYRREDLRYGKVIIMTDADVDGAHIACLLMTFFYRQMPQLIREGHLFLAVPPLYRLTQGTKSVYARDDAHKEEILRTVLSPKQKVEVSRFKGLGEMMPQHLRETTMDPKTRSLLSVRLGEEDADQAHQVVEDLMGAKSDPRFALISEKAHLFSSDALDV